MSVVRRRLWIAPASSRPAMSRHCESDSRPRCISQGRARSRDFLMHSAGAESFASMRTCVSHDMPTVTIGILTHNALSYIGRTIPAILSWKRPEYEVLVVDNGSTDGTVERLRQYPQVR